MKRLCLIVVGVVCTFAVADAQSFSVQSKPARGHAKVATVASSALRSGGLGGINFSNPYAPPVGAGKTAIAPFPTMPTGHPVRFGVSNSSADAQGPWEVEGLEVMT
jgi:hypothetical protein